ncbi:MAG: hypothetical protein ACXABV_17020 [Candidatus Thorarchaeota archaeon]
MSIERKSIKNLLVLGLVLFLLTGANLGTDIFYYVWKFIAGAIGLFLIIVSGGTLLVKEHMTRREANLYFVGLVLVGLTPTLLIYSQLAQNVRVEIWWIFQPFGAVMLVIGSLLILWSWLQRGSSESSEISFNE